MNDYLLIKFLHLIGFAYWLGCDLGVFYTSYVVTDDKQPDAVRVVAAKILLALDQVPRMSMTMMLPLGTHLAWAMGVLPVDAALVAGVWLVGIAWLASVITLHRASPGAFRTRLARVDFVFRLVVAAGLVVAGLVAWIGGGPLPYWVAAKYALFGAMVGLGLMIRIKLGPFGPAFGALAAGQAGDTENRVIRNSLAATRPYVLGIWACILLSAAFGIHLL
jgi:hypothetical protein